MPQCLFIHVDAAAAAPRGDAAAAAPPVMLLPLPQALLCVTNIYLERRVNQLTW